MPCPTTTTSAEFSNYPSKVEAIDALIRNLEANKEALFKQLERISPSKRNKIKKHKDTIADLIKQIYEQSELRDEIKAKWTQAVAEMEATRRVVEAEKGERTIDMFTPVYGGTTSKMYGGPVAVRDLKKNEPAVQCLAGGVQFDGKPAALVARHAVETFKGLFAGMTDAPGMHGYTGSMYRPWMMCIEEEDTLEPHEALRYKLETMERGDPSYAMYTTLYSVACMLLTLNIGDDLEADPTTETVRKYLALHTGMMIFNRKNQKETTELVCCALFAHSVPECEEANCRYERLDDVWGEGRHSVCMVATRDIPKGEPLRAHLKWPTLHTWFLQMAQATHGVRVRPGRTYPVSIESMRRIQWLTDPVQEGSVIGSTLLFLVPDDSEDVVDYLKDFPFKIQLICCNGAGIHTMQFTICTSCEWISYVGMLHDLLLGRAKKTSCDIVKRAIRMTGELMSMYADMGADGLDYETAVLHYLFLFFSGRIAKGSGKDEASKLDVSRMYFSPIDWPGRHANVLMVPQELLSNGDVAVSYTADSDLCATDRLAPNIGLRTLMSYMRNHPLEPTLDENGKAEVRAGDGSMFMLTTVTERQFEETPLFAPLAGRTTLDKFLVEHNGPHARGLDATRGAIVARSPLNVITFPVDVKEVTREFVDSALQDLCGGWESYLDAPGMQRVSESLPSRHPVLEWFLGSAEWATSDPTINQTWYKMLHGLVAAVCRHEVRCLENAPLPLRATLAYILIHGGLEFDPKGTGGTGGTGYTRLLCSPLMHSCPLAGPGQYNAEVRTIGAEFGAPAMLCVKTTRPVVAYEDLRAEMRCWTVWRFCCQHCPDTVSRQMAIAAPEIPTVSHISMTEIIVCLNGVSSGQHIGRVQCSAMCSVAEFDEFMVHSGAVPMMMRFWTGALFDAHKTVNVMKLTISTVQGWIDHLHWLREYLDRRRGERHSVSGRAVLRRAELTLEVLLSLYADEEYAQTVSFTESLLQYLALYFVGTPRDGKAFGSLIADHVYFQPAFFAVPQSETPNAVFTQRAGEISVFEVVASRDIPARQFVVAEPLIDNLWAYTTRIGSRAFEAESPESSPVSSDECPRKKNRKKSVLSKAVVIPDVASVNAMHAEEERKLTEERARMRAEEKRAAQEADARRKAERQAAANEEAARKEAQRLANLAMYAAQGKLIPAKKAAKKNKPKKLNTTEARSESPMSSPVEWDESPMGVEGVSRIEWDEALRLQEEHDKRRTIEELKRRYDECHARTEEIRARRDAAVAERKELSDLTAADVVATLEYERQIEEIKAKLAARNTALDERTSALISMGTVVQDLEQETHAALKAETEVEEELTQLTAECTCGEPVTRFGYKCGHYSTCDKCIAFAQDRGYMPVCMQCTLPYLPDGAPRCG